MRLIKDFVSLQCTSLDLETCNFPRHLNPLAFHVWVIKPVEDTFAYLTVTSHKTKQANWQSVAGVKYSFYQTFSALKEIPLSNDVLAHWRAWWFSYLAAEPEVGDSVPTLCLLGSRASLGQATQSVFPQKKGVANHV